MRWSDEQSRVLAGSGNMLVSASAGSGKTTVMVEKTLRLIKEGTDIRRILLMTFTRAAAREMREKLVKKMYEEARGEYGGKIREQLANLPFANIETIDGFCFSLMKKYFNLVGCDPGATVGDEKTMARALDESVDKAMAKLFAEGKEYYTAATDFFRKRRSYKPFKDTVLSVMRFASSGQDKKRFYETVAGTNTRAIEEYYLKHGRHKAGYLLRALEGFIERCGIEAYAGSSAYAEITERLSAAVGARTASEFISVTVGITVPAKINKRLVDGGKVSEALAADSARINERLRAFKESVIEDGKAHIAKENGQQEIIKRAIAETCIIAEREYAEYKKRRGIVDMRDATDYALAILADKSAREEIKGRFDYVFVDEYQDTNYLQEALIEGVGNGNVFSVGDVKQAIYHFRSAEPEIFLKRGERFDTSNDGSNYFLNTNYRSCEEILDFTNRVCNAVMIKDFCGIDYKGTSGLSYGGSVKPISGAPAVSVFVNEERKERPLPSRGEVYSVRDAAVAPMSDRESEFIASEIISMTEKAEIDAGGTRRRVRYGDIAVLVRTNSRLKTIRDTLNNYGIPCFTMKEKKDAFPERETLVDVLRVVFNADNDIPLYNALSSPIGNIDDASLVSIRSQRLKEKNKISLWESLNTYNGDPKTEKKIKEFIEFIEKLRLESAFMTAEEILREILSRNFDAFLKARASETLAEINAFIAYVGGLACNRSCEDFLEYYDTCYDGNKPPVAENAVAVMTMHGSKGLEFPVVFLPYQSSGSFGTVGNTELDRELGLAVRLFKEEEKTVGDSFATRVIRMKCNDEERQEAARLMYVAFTRARNRLIISGSKTKTPVGVFDCSSVMQWIMFAAEEDEWLRDRIRPLPDAVKREGVEVDIEKKEFFGRGLKKKYAYEKETVLPVKYSVSEVLKKQDGYGFNPFSDRDLSAAITAGTAVHSVMQYIDYGTDTLEGVEAAADRMAEEGILTLEEREALDCRAILRTLGSDIIKEARRHASLREQPFVMYVAPEGHGERVLVQGVIDLLIDEGDGYVVVDFKTGRATSEQLLERYSKQLELYAEGVEKILKKPVIKKVIYSVTTGKEISVS